MEKASYLDLIPLIRSGDKDIFTRIFNHFYAPLCNYATTILKYPEIAEEVVQETFIKIWENHQNFNIDVSLHAYLFRSVHNNCISYCRKHIIEQKKYRIFQEEICFHAEIITRNLSENTLEAIINGEIQKFLDQVIVSLPEQCNKIFHLSRHEQLTNKEIAAKLGISLNTVKTQLSRAYRKLKDAYHYFKNK